MVTPSWLLPLALQPVTLENVPDPSTGSALVFGGVSQPTRMPGPTEVQVTGEYVVA